VANVLKRIGISHEGVAGRMVMTVDDFWEAGADRRTFADWMERRMDASFRLAADPGA